MSMEQQNTVAQRLEVAVQSAYPNEPDVPDVYADGMGVQFNFSSVSFLFTRTSKDPPKAPTVAVVRVSPQQAFMISHVMRKAIAAYEAQFGAIRIPDDMRSALGIEEE